MKIRTEWVGAGWDNNWTAIDDDTYDGADDSTSPIGYGTTEEEAKMDLLQQIALREEERRNSKKLGCKFSFFRGCGKITKMESFRQVILSPPLRRARAKEPGPAALARVQKGMRNYRELIRMFGVSILVTAAIFGGLWFAGVWP